MGDKSVAVLQSKLQDLKEDFEKMYTENREDHQKMQAHIEKVEIQNVRLSAIVSIVSPFFLVALNEIIKRLFN